MNSSTLPARTGPTSAPVPPRRPSGAGRVVTAAVALVLTGGVAVTALGAMTAQRGTRDVVVQEQLTAVVVRGEVGDVSVRADPGATRTTVRVSSVGGWSRAESSAQVENGVLQVVSSCGSVWPGPCSVAFEVVVPEGLDLDVTTGTGDQDLTGAFGAVRFDSDTGHVSWARARATSVTGRVGTGDVDVQGSVPDVRVTGETGAVRLALDTPPSEVLATTTTGDVRILVPDDGTRYDAGASSTVGRTQVAVPTAGPPAPRLAAVTGTGSAVVGLR